MIDFGELTKTTVHVGIGGGNWIEVPMLSVADYEEVAKMQAELLRLNEAQDTTDAARMAAVLEAQKKMLELARKAIPVELHDGLARLDFERLSKLILLLCTGKDEAEGDEPEKKMTLPSQARQ